MVNTVDVFLCGREERPLSECISVTLEVTCDATMGDIASRATEMFVTKDPSLGRGETVTTHAVAVHPILAANSGHLYDVAEAIYFGIDDDGRVIYTSNPEEMLYRHFARAESRVDRGYDPRRLAMGRLGGTGGDEFVFVNILGWLNDNGLASATLSALSTTLVSRHFPVGIPKWVSRSGRETRRAGRAVSYLLADQEADVVQVEQWFRRRKVWDEAVVAEQLARTVPEVRWLMLRMGYRQSKTSQTWALPENPVNLDRARWMELLESDQPADYKVDW